MRSEAWQDKQLNTVLGSWAELKHDTVLYAKQVYAELGGGPPPPPPAPPKGYVEPVPVFYARLAALTEMTREGLETRGLLSEEDKQGLLRLETLARDLHSIAASELYGDALKPEDYERIRFYGGELEELTMLASDKEGEEQPGTPVFMEEEQQAAVIADVATDPDPGGPEFFEPIVLEVGVGRINEIFAVVPVVEPDGSQYLQVAKGGVFSYYEFPWPASDRLTDEKWREMLTQDQAPALQPWTSSFYVEQGEYANLSVPIISYHTNVTYLFWSPSDSLASLDANSEQFRAELQSLASQKQYVGHQLLYFQVRSVDIQSNTQAVVTVREVWHDKLYSYSGDYPTYEEEAIAERRALFTRCHLHSRTGRVRVWLILADCQCCLCQSNPRLVNLSRASRESTSSIFLLLLISICVWIAISDQHEVERYGAAEETADWLFLRDGIIPPFSGEDVEIVVTGDIMPGRETLSEGDPFRFISREVAAADLAFGNLEGVITPEEIRESCLRWSKHPPEFRLLLAARNRIPADEGRISTYLEWQITMRWIAGELE